LAVLLAVPAAAGVGDAAADSEVPDGIVVVAADAGVVVAVVDTADDVAVAAVVGVDGPHPLLAACKPGSCGSTTVDIVLHNSMDYYKSDIGSFYSSTPQKGQWGNYVHAYISVPLK